MRIFHFYFSGFNVTPHIFPAGTDSRFIRNVRISNYRVEEIECNQLKCLYDLAKYTSYRICTDDEHKIEST